MKTPKPPKPPKPILMWAPVIHDGKIPWVYHSAIRRTRWSAKAAYLEGAHPENYARYLENVTFEKVVVEPLSTWEKR